VDPCQHRPQVPDVQIVTNYSVFGYEEVQGGGGSDGATGLAAAGAAAAAALAAAAGAASYGNLRAKHQFCNSLCIRGKMHEHMYLSCRIRWKSVFDVVFFFDAVRHRTMVYPLLERAGLHSDFHCLNESSVAYHQPRRIRNEQN
jgi:hypothetical protein